MAAGFVSLAMVAGGWMPVGSPRPTTLGLVRGMRQSDGEQITPMLEGGFGAVSTDSDPPGFVSALLSIGRDVAEVRAGVSHLTADVAGMRTDVASMRTDLSGVRGGIGELTTALRSSAKKLEEHESLLGRAKWGIVGVASFLGFVGAVATIYLAIRALLGR